MFPTIKTIDDVLPAIKGHDEFIVAERPFGTVINYLVALEDSFDDPIRRECRGIIFYPDGRIMSRPYHKFFNLGEKNETKPANLDFGDNPVIMDKLDGSMIRPVVYENKHLGENFASWRFGTKMGTTDVAAQCQEWLQTLDLETFEKYIKFIGECIKNDVTPLFEWCSRQQRIVVDYPEDQLILTAMRNNVSGTYAPHHWLEATGLPVVKKWTKGAELEDLQEYASVANDIEGWVCAWPCGKRVKIKVDWYVTLHKAKEAICREKYVIDAILNDFLDDLKGKLLDEDREKVEKFENAFTNGVGKIIHEVTDIYNALYICLEVDRDILQDYIEDEKALNASMRKRAAQEIQRKPKWMQPILFQILDGKPIADSIINQLKKLTKTQTMIDANRHIWGGARYEYGAIGND